MRVRAERLQLPPGGVVIVAPHPDDEAIGCAGLIRRAKLSGHAVHCIFLTAGEASHRDHPTLTAADIKEMRQNEAISATACLGLTHSELTFLNLPDGKLPCLSPEQMIAGIDAVTACLKSQRPAAVLITHANDGSSEHVAAYQLMIEVLRHLRQRPRLFQYLVWSAYSPRLFWRLFFERGRIYRIDLSEHIAEKQSALAAYRSQFWATPPWTQAVQPADFLKCISLAEEFLFESTP